MFCLGGFLAFYREDSRPAFPEGILVTSDVSCLHLDTQLSQLRVVHPFLPHVKQNKNVFGLGQLGYVCPAISHCQQATGFGWLPWLLEMLFA